MGVVAAERDTPLAQTNERELQTCLGHVSSFHRGLT